VSSEDVISVNSVNLYQLSSVLAAQDLSELPHFRAEWEPGIRATTEWILEYVLKEHPQLGRSGPVCPMCAPAIRAQTFWIGVSNVSTTDEVTALLMEMRDRWLVTPPVTGRGVGIKTFVLVLPLILPNDPDGVIRQSHEICKPDYLDKGMILGEFFEGHPKPSLHNEGMTPLGHVPYPLYVLREMVPFDIVHMSERYSFIDAYVRKFGPMMFDTTVRALASGRRLSELNVARLVKAIAYIVKTYPELRVGERDVVTGLPDSNQIFRELQTDPPAGPSRRALYTVRLHSNFHSAQSSPYSSPAPLTPPQLSEPPPSFRSLRFSVPPSAERPLVRDEDLLAFSDNLAKLVRSTDHLARANDVPSEFLLLTELKSPEGMDVLANKIREIGVACGIPITIGISIEGVDCTATGQWLDNPNRRGALLVEAARTDALRDYPTIEPPSGVQWQLDRPPSDLLPRDD
jgi:hypothetical protein